MVATGVSPWWVSFQMISHGVAKDCKTIFRTYGAYAQSIENHGLAAVAMVYRRSAARIGCASRDILSRKCIGFGSMFHAGLYPNSSRRFR